MDCIDEMHVCEPGLVVLDITVSDEETAVAVMSLLDEPSDLCGGRGEPGVRTRVYADT
ncbi:hypothetical protein GA0115260_102422 [Streptomyces sp. MnatMP-M27]|uniref:DUF6207 family protein n=1 Tax=Streptomyces sp. MnatMP-M27 TaxID=1839768 RepID=UPI00081E4696|nr:DUF6207 family protein [Streptomyces sp. MnatMP-M27]SCF78031.1 hypothetical protein GA0115260_102422 [Streptomyces sp. MnatMP-M27]